MCHDRWAPETVGREGRRRTTGANRAVAFGLPGGVPTGGAGGGAGLAAWACSRVWLSAQTSTMSSALRARLAAPARRIGL